MSGHEPLRKIDLAMLGLYGIFMTCVAVWFLLALVGFIRPEGKMQWFEAALSSGPPVLVAIQGGFFLLASQARPFRQRIMASGATSRDALIGTAVLWLGALLFLPLWVG